MPTDPTPAVWVYAWDVVDGGVLGALVRCPDCPCQPGYGCDGDGQLHRPYRLPGGAPIDLHRDADLLMPILDRSGPALPKEAPDAH